MMEVYGARSLGFNVGFDVNAFSYTAHRFFSLIRET